MSKQEAFVMGTISFANGMHSAPALNSEFISKISALEYKDRMSAYREYIRGWTCANLVAN